MKEENWDKLSIAIYVFVNPLIIMLIWNWIMVKFGMIEINYLEAFALKYLCGSLFKTNNFILDSYRKIQKIEDEKLKQENEEIGLIKKEIGLIKKED